ncbi:TauD/TfdA family dioxygenase [Bacillus atrophaeus]|uniref:TauD/TfdA family dioxygenase n=1 Tax=Bacillus atrophaeus TaxID=1452 RepID=UPI00227DA3BD|nr:TauD/TfdA family dioxygenase [Bacillus atrophaeus]MCY8973121.1 TauD/TfdA family dioxygenase [Bacillus atrophaeus]MCY9198685.1 TauD/TfdA family dioxygenase [Bacillus atrophaeus]
MNSSIAKPEIKNSYIYVLTDKEKEELSQLVNSISVDLNQLNYSTLNELEKTSYKIPNKLLDHLISFKREKNQKGVILFRNLPIDKELPDTPSNGEPAKNKKGNISELLLYLFMLHLGEPIGYADEKKGQIIHDICPIKGKETNLENSGSQVFFTYHTEDAIHPHKPDYLSLVCLRSDHEEKAVTETASIVEALELLPGYAIDLLRQPLYRLSPPSSFNSPELSVQTSVLSGNIIKPDLCIHGSLMEGVNDEARWALEELKKALSEVSSGVVLKPGDLIIIDNHLAAHARTAFKPKYDGKDRWLQRMFAVVDINKSSASRSIKSHVCMPLKIELELQK